MEAISAWKIEGKEVLNLMLAPFETRRRPLHDDAMVRPLTQRSPNDIYNFKGLSFHKVNIAFRKFLYFVNRLLANNDIYFASCSTSLERFFYSGNVVVGQEGLAASNAEKRGEL
jgi:hypothetical protein